MKSFEGFARAEKGVPSEPILQLTIVGTAPLLAIEEEKFTASVA